ncbi:hypothetical protein TrST_g9274 [Triparma strigata]|uniref:AFG1-like ATPase n=1 Tax=Triparma strigata TaxID=1606541 RepID=A0A9W7A1D7_9STRA|nr:hypothetical protein TrST_g9274 [Triparma strigata]
MDICNMSPSSFFSSDCSDASALQSAYDGMINSKEGFKRDAFQQNAIDSLSDLQRSLASLNVKQAKGVYMHGGVGSGKTFVMDLFYDTAPTVKKRRMHFTSFMLEMHKRMAAKQKEREAQISGGFLKRILPKIHDDIGGTADSSTERSFSLFGTKIVLSSGNGEYNAVDEDNEDPLPVIAKEIVGETFLLCLDEFEVTDVADAFVLARLFEALFAEGLVLVTTSNRKPSDLYYNGLNRQVFMPTINAIEKSCEVISLEDSPVDYRGLKTRESGGEIFMAGEDGAKMLGELWAKAAKKGGPVESLTLTEASRKILVDATVEIKGGRVCKFDFKDLCESSKMPLGNSEFAMIANSFDEIFVDNIPNFNKGGSTIDGLRRFVLFVDACYDAKVRVYFSSKHTIQELWDNKEEIYDPRSLNKHGDLLGGASVVPVDTFTRFSLDRTISRLYEMSSDEYIGISGVEVKEAERNKKTKIIL